MAQTLNYTIGADRRAFVKDIQNFKIDFADDNNNWVQARQFERGMRQVFVNILNEDHTPFDMTGCNVWFEGLLPENAKGDFRVIDDTGFVPIDLQNGQFRFDLPGHAFTVAGSYRQAFFRIVKNGNSVTTLEFDLEVLADKVIGGLVPKDWIGPFEEIADKLVDDLNKHTDAADKIIAGFQQKVTDLINQLNQQGSTTTSMLTELQNRIASLEAKIQQDDLITKPELDAFKQTIQKTLNDAIADLNNRLTAVENNLEPYSVEQADFNGKDVMHHGHLAVHKKTYGRYQNAAGMSVMVNGDDKAKVEGASLEFIAKHYTGRDSAGLYVENSRIPYLLQTTDTRFTATSVTVLDESVDLSNVKPGMLIDTSKRANIDKDWYVTAVKSVDGRTINTELWYKVQSDPNAETVTGTPADGLAITVNPTVGIWGINSNIYLPQEDAESGSAMELGVYSASKVPQDVVGLRVTSGQEDINDGVHVTGNVHQAYNAANRDGGTAYNVAPGAKVDYYFRAQNADNTTNYFINSQGQAMHETLVPHFTGTFKDLNYGKDTSLLIINSEGDQTITLDYGRYGRIIHIVTTGTGVKTIVANPASSSATPGASWFLSPDTEQGNASEIKLNREAGKPSVNLVDLGSLFAVL